MLFGHYLGISWYLTEAKNYHSWTTVVTSNLTKHLSAQ